MNTKGADRSESRQPVPIEIFNYLIFEDSGTGPKVSIFIYNSEDRSQINIYITPFLVSHAHILETSLTIWR